MKTDPSETSFEDTITEEILESTLLTTNINTESNLSALFTNKTTIFDKKTTTLKFSNSVGSSTSGTFKSSTQLITNSYGKLESEWIINTTNSAILAIYKNDLIIVNNSHFGFFDLQTGASKSFYEHDLLEPCVFGVIFNERLVIGDCFNLTLNIWYIDKLIDQSTKILQVNSRYKFQCLTVLINGDLAIGWNDNVYDIVILDSYKGSQKYTLVGHNDKVNQILQRNDEYIISCSIDKAVIIWDSSGSLIKKIEYQESVISIAISNYLFAVGLADKVIEVIHLKNGKIINSFQAHQQPLCKHQCLIYLGDQSLLSASLDKTLKIWNPDFNSLNTTIFLHTTDVEQLFFKNDLLFSRSSAEIIKWSTAE
ncbi:WD40 repeat-containing [Brachionus plicatilis]|uniref:WD40 repeat-containing n=1 Tax=Brachionus plicatilis TaxID=10195 RepID=A0A3M7QW05_BRAPC|nr:WD40 repeat-containing [Brachionus plicatilis]